jgi:hypothetical protein
MMYIFSALIGLGAIGFEWYFTRHSDTWPITEQYLCSVYTRITLAWTVAWLLLLYENW